MQKQQIINKNKSFKCAEGYPLEEHNIPYVTISEKK
jgi:hypothetical protein